VTEFESGGTEVLASQTHGHYQRVPCLQTGISMLEQYVAAVRDAIGMELPLSMDHLGHLGVKSIIRLGKAYEKYNLSWMEDVIPWTDTDLLRQISDQSPTPILTGEDIYLKEPFHVLCDRHAVGKIQPDLFELTDLMGIGQLQIRSQERS
jgi:L-alanine-DL-glutamate epimerase-like enolase superfamily enzyme